MIVICDIDNKQCHYCYLILLPSLFLRETELLLSVFRPSESQTGSSWSSEAQQTLSRQGRGRGRGWGRPISSRCCVFNEAAGCACGGQIAEPRVVGSSSTSGPLILCQHAGSSTLRPHFPSAPPSSTQRFLHQRFSQVTICCFIFMKHSRPHSQFQNKSQHVWCNLFPS